MMRTGLLVLLLTAALLSGCSQPVTPAGTGPDGRPRVEAASRVTSGMPESTVGVASSDIGISARSEGVSPPPFGAAARAGGSGFDADTVLAVRHGTHEGFERVVLDLGAGAAPAETVPRYTLTSPKDDGLLRVELPSASVTNVSGGDLGDGALESFYVVRAPNGGVFVDVFAREAFRYRVLELEDPARIVLDFKPTGAPPRRPLPAAQADTVLTEPRPGSRISDPLTVSGYSRNFEAANTITLTDAGGEVLVRRTVTGNDWTSTWGYFEATIDLPPFSGRGTLRVGAADARDGTFRGVEIPLRGR